MAPTSRLKRHRVRESKRQLFIYSGIFVVLVILMLTFGGRVIEFIGNASLLVRGNDEEQSLQEEVSVVQAPILSDMPDATSENKLTIEGSVTTEGGTVDLYINNKKFDSTSLSSGTDFTFDITLEEGENIIRARYTINEVRSEFSDSQIISYIKEPPKLEEISPSDGQTFKRGDQRIEVSGKTDPEALVTINGFRAVVDNAGNFSYFLRLNEGENKIEIVATNKAGLTEKQEIKVNYSP